MVTPNSWYEDAKRILAREQGALDPRTPISYRANGWGFWDETWANWHGGYQSKEDATTALGYYADVLEGKPCPCAPCTDWRTEGESEGGCFTRFGEGHGPCCDTWGQSCFCLGTAVDGECEACWLWIK